MIRIITLCILILSAINMNSRGISTKKILSLAEYKVENPNLFTTLDTIFETCRYSKGATIFYLQFNVLKSKKDLIFISTNFEQMIPYSNILGYFTYRKRIFFINGNIVDSTILQKTCKYRKFDFTYRYFLNSKGQPVMRDTDDFASWSMRYKSDAFILLSFFSHESEDKWFNKTEAEYGPGAMDDPDLIDMGDGQKGTLMPSIDW